MQGSPSSKKKRPQDWSADGHVHEELTTTYRGEEDVYVIVVGVIVYMNYQGRLVHPV